jgi:predicted transcriptional regulator
MPRPSRPLYVAAGVLAGQSTSQIAAEIGVTARRVRQLIEADETRQIITAVVNDRFEFIVELFERSLEVIRRAMTAKLRNKDGAVIGPDHYARLAAVSQMIKILTAGRPIPKAPEPKREEEGSLITSSSARS